MAGEFKFQGTALDFGGLKGINLADPSGAQDAVTLAFLNAKLNQQTMHPEVRIATNANIASLSAPGASIDGVALSAGDRILLYGQSTGSQNGPWVWNGAASALTRPTDYTTASVLQGDLFPVVAGTHAGTLAMLTTSGAITVDTTATTWILSGAGTSYVAGNGLSLTGSTFAVVAGNGILADGTSTRVDSSVVAKKFSGTIGNGSSTTLTVTHGLNNIDAGLAGGKVRRVSDGAVFMMTPSNLSANAFDLVFSSAPATNDIAVCVIG